MRSWVSVFVSMVAAGAVSAWIAEGDEPWGLGAHGATSVTDFGDAQPLGAGGSLKAVWQPVDKLDGSILASWEEEVGPYENAAVILVGKPMQGRAGRKSAGVMFRQSRQPSTM